MGLSFAIAAGPHQRYHSQVGVPRDSWPHFIVSDSRLPQPGGPGPCFYIPQENGGLGISFFFGASYDSQGHGVNIRPRLYTVFFFLTQLSQSKIQLCYDRRFSRPVCLGIKHPSGAYDQNFLTVRQLQACWCGALSLRRGRVCRLPDSINSNKSLVCMHNLHFTSYEMYVYTTYTRPLSVQAQYSRSCLIISSSCYNSTLVTWTVVCLTAAKFKPLIFPVSWFSP
jgi:hypothetical protein